MITNKANVSLTWGIFGTEETPVYKVYLGQSQDSMAIKYNGLVKNFQELKDLSQGIYYWKITAIVPNYQGSISSEIWSFEVDFNHVPQHDIYLQFEMAKVEVER